MNTVNRLGYVSWITPERSSILRLPFVARYEILDPLWRDIISRIDSIVLGSQFTSTMTFTDCTSKCVNVQLILNQRSFCGVWRNLLFFHQYPLVSDSPRHALAVEVFEQRKRVLSAAARRVAHGGERYVSLYRRNFIHEGRLYLREEKEAARHYRDALALKKYTPIEWGRFCEFLGIEANPR